MRHDESSPSVLKRLRNFCAVKLRASQKISLSPERRPLHKRANEFSLWKALSKTPVAMPDQFLVFEKVLKKRRRTWRWRVCTPDGDVVMDGSERSRAAARYQADRALFLLLLSAPYQSIRRVARTRAKIASKIALGFALFVLCGITADGQNLTDLLF